MEVEVNGVEVNGVEVNGRARKKIDKELCQTPFSGKYRKTSSEIDIDKEPIMLVQFMQVPSQMLSSDMQPGSVYSNQVCATDRHLMTFPSSSVSGKRSRD